MSRVTSRGVIMGSGGVLKRDSNSYGPGLRLTGVFNSERTSDKSIASKSLLLLLTDDGGVELLVFSVSVRKGGSEGLYPSSSMVGSWNESVYNPV